MAQKGFLLVFMNPSPAFDEEFNAWYDSDHIHERLSVPGFLTGLRYINIAGGALRYLALYDLENYGVLETPEYLCVAYGLRAALRREVMRYRVLVDPGTGQGADAIGFVEARAPLPEGFDPSAFGSASDTVDLVAGYNLF